MIICMFLNNFRGLKKIIMNKFDISDELSNIIIKVYYIAGLTCSGIIAYFSVGQELIQIYFLILSSWIIISMPKCNRRIKYMNLINQTIKGFMFIPTVIISILMNPIISIMIILLAIEINNIFYYKIIKAMYRNYFIVIGVLILILLNSIAGFIFYFSVLIVICFKLEGYMNQKIYINGMVSFLIIFSIKEYITKYDEFGIVLIGIYLVVTTRNAIFCQQEQFYNIKKSFLNLEIKIKNKLNIIYNYNYEFILTYIMVHYPLTFIVVYYKTNNMIYTIILSILISILQSNLYCSLLLYGTVKFFSRNTLIFNISDFMIYRFSPLFVLASIPIASIYYLYVIFELKIVVVLSVLIIIIIATSVFHRIKLKKIVLNMLEE